MSGALDVKRSADMLARSAGRLAAAATDSAAGHDGWSQQGMLFSRLIAFLRLSSRLSSSAALNSAQRGREMGALASAPALRAAGPAAQIGHLRAQFTCSRLQRCRAEAHGSAPPAADSSGRGGGKPAAVAIEYRGQTVQAIHHWDVAMLHASTYWEGSGQTADMPCCRPQLLCPAAG